MQPNFKNYYKATVLKCVALVKYIYIYVCIIYIYNFSKLGGLGFL